MRRLRELLRLKYEAGLSHRAVAQACVELFVGVLGASGLIYAEATRSQDLASWVSAHVRMLEYVGGSPAIWVGVHVTWRVPKSRIARPRRRRTGDNRHVTSSTSG